MTVPPSANSRRKARQHGRRAGPGAARRRPSPCRRRCHSAVRSGNPGAARSRRRRPRGGGRQGAAVAAQRQLVLPLPADAEVARPRSPRPRPCPDRRGLRGQTGPGRRTRGTPSAFRWARSGAVLMLSTPPARYSGCPPAATSRAASTIASRPEPHCRSTVMPGTLTGSPASRAASRATFPPPPTALPITTSATDAGAAPASASRRAEHGGQEFMGAGRSSSAPLARQIGVRRAAMMTGCRSSEGHAGGWAAAQPRRRIRGSLRAIQSSSRFRLTLPRSVSGQFGQDEVLQRPFVPRQHVLQAGLQLGGGHPAVRRDDAGHHLLAAEVVRAYRRPRRRPHRGRRPAPAPPRAGRRLCRR